MCSVQEGLACLKQTCQEEYAAICEHVYQEKTNVANYKHLGTRWRPYNHSLYVLSAFL